MLKIRLSRRGRKHRPFYAIVVADVRAPRDGRFIEKIGTYDPLQGPSVMHIKADRLMDWLFNGAQPTKTVRHLCSSAGLLLIKHLLEGLHKGCIDKKTAHKRFVQWEKVVEKRKRSIIKLVSTLPLPHLIDNAQAAQQGAEKAMKKSKN